MAARREIIHAFVVTWNATPTEDRAALKRPDDFEVPGGFVGDLALQDVTYSCHELAMVSAPFRVIDVKPGEVVARAVHVPFGTLTPVPVEEPPMAMAA